VAEGGQVKNTPLSDSVRLICIELFGPKPQPQNFPTEYWMKLYPMDIVIYALLEAERKYRRTPNMSSAQVVNFANTVMDRKLAVTTQP
jgi:hypothetical protein